MKKRLVLTALLLLLPLVAYATEYSNFTNLAFSGYLAVGAIGSETNIFDSSGNMTVAGTFANTGATSQFTNATSSIFYTPDFRIGYDSGSYLKFAVADTSGAVTVTQAGNAQTLGWTVPAATWTNSTSDYVYTPDFRVGYDSGSYLKFAVADTTGGVTITHGGNASAVDWTATTFAMTNATSHTVYTPSWALGYDAGAAMTVAVSDTTGNIAVTQAGSTQNVAWTTAGAVSLTWPTSTITSQTSSTVYTPSFVVGYDAGASMTVAVSDTTGNVAISHAGSTKSITWTAAGGFDFVGAFAADALTLSDVLTFSDGGTIDNTAADTLTVTETNIALVGAVSASSLTVPTAATNSDYLKVTTFKLDYTQTASQTVGVIPANAYVVKVEVAVTTLFNGGGTDLLDIGIDGGAANAYANDMDLSAAGYITAGGTFSALGSVGGANRTITCLYVDQNADASAGSALVNIYWRAGSIGD